MKPNGYAIWSGPSEIDGEPIVVLLTGFKIATANKKMGETALQSWILSANVEPVLATLTGADASICGDCPHRGRLEDGGNPGRSCYVNVGLGVQNIWAAWKRGNYPAVERVTDLIRLGQSRMIRIGSYGDPAAVPFWVWTNLAHGAAFHMGYTHRWRRCDPRFRTLCMASVDTAEEREEARTMGWRTFRVRRHDQPLLDREIICPASAEAGKKLQCEDCRACSGLGGKARADVAIIAHGSRARTSNFDRRGG